MSAGVHVEEAVFRAIDRVNELLPESSALAKCSEEPLAGAGSKLDSMGIVNLIVAVEDEVAHHCGAHLNLANARGTGASDPLETVGSLVCYLQGALGKA